MGHDIDVKDFSLDFATLDGEIKILDHISFSVKKGEIVGLVGESGSGKTITATSLLRLLPEQAIKKSGSVQVLEEDIFSMTEHQMENIRGAKIAMIFQEPMTALNPTLKIKEQIEGVISRHQKMTPDQIRERAENLLLSMNIHDVGRVLSSYPFELSGGMRQRVLIAMAFSCNPAVLVADEPTTALDMTVQSQVLDLIRHQARETKTSVLLITHDMGVISHMCDRVYVMHAGQIVEAGAVDSVLSNPVHPYTTALLGTLPERSRPKQRLPTLSGSVGSLINPPPGCRFAPRCPRVGDDCTVRPNLEPISLKDHDVACWRAKEIIDAR